MSRTTGIHISFIIQEALMILMSVLLWNVVGWWLGIYAGVLGSVITVLGWVLVVDAVERKKRVRHE